MPGPPLTGAEALMWALDDEPTLRSTFISVSLLDRPADLDRLRARLEAAADQVPVLRQRVVGTPLGLVAPYWADDPDFDVSRHVRAEVVPAPGGLPELLELAAARSAEPFDPSHPLWQLTVVDGLEDGKGALLAKLHHVLSDGVGAIRLSASFLDVSPDAEPPRRRKVVRPPSQHHGPDLSGPVVAGAEELWRVAGAFADGIGRFVRAPATAATEAWEAALAIGRQALMVEPARSPLWSGRAHAHRYEVASLGLEDVRTAGKALGGTVNDVFVTIVAAAAGAYHRARGAGVDELRVSVPVSTRRAGGPGRNAWAPARVLVPVGDMAPAQRLTEVHRRLVAAKSDPSLALADAVAGSARVLLPRSLLVQVALRGVATVDFACSNVRGAPFDLWVAGSHVEANYPFGPTAGVAFNATVLSYRDVLCLGLNVDTGAVDDPGALRAAIEAAAAEVLAAGRRPPRRPPGRPLGRAAGGRGAGAGPAAAGQLGGNA